MYRDFNNANPPEECYKEWLHKLVTEGKLYSKEEKLVPNQARQLGKKIRTETKILPISKYTQKDVNDIEYLFPQV